MGIMHAHPDAGPHLEDDGRWHATAGDGKPAEHRSLSGLGEILDRRARH